MSLAEDYRQALDMVAHEDITVEESQQGYSIRADTYDKHLQFAQYGGPQTIRRRACECYPPSMRSTVKILDVAAGTGLVGIELKEAGFVHVDALDPCEDMIRKAKERDLYENYFLEFLTSQELDIPKGTYDGLTGSGIYNEGEGHLQPEAFYEMIRLVKPGGYIWLAFRNSFLRFPQYHGVGRLIKQLEEEGKWRVVSQTVEPNYNSGEDGCYWVFQVL